MTLTIVKMAVKHTIKERGHAKLLKWFIQQPMQNVRCALQIFMSFDRSREIIDHNGHRHIAYIHY